MGGARLGKLLLPVLSREIILGALKGDQGPYAMGNDLAREISQTFLEIERCTSPIVLFIFW